MASLAAAFSRIKTTAVRVLVRVKIGNIRGSREAMPEGQAYMCWVKRNGRARGTDLVRSTKGLVEFNETVKISPITLYRNKDGTYQPKPYAIEIIRNDASKEAPGKVFGRVQLDLSKNFELQRCRVLDCSVDDNCEIELGATVVFLDANDQVPKSPSASRTRQKEQEQQRQRQDDEERQKQMHEQEMKHRQQMHEQQMKFQQQMQQQQMMMLHSPASRSGPPPVTGYPGTEQQMLHQQQQMMYHQSHQQAYEQQMQQELVSQQPPMSMHSGYPPNPQMQHSNPPMQHPNPHMQQQPDLQMQQYPHAHMQQNVASIQYQAPPHPYSEQERPSMESVPQLQQHYPHPMQNQGKGSMSTPNKAGISQPLQSIANIANHVPKYASPGISHPISAPSFNESKGESKEEVEEAHVAPAQNHGPGTQIPATPVVDRPENHTVRSAWGGEQEA